MNPFEQLAVSVTELLNSSRELLEKHLIGVTQPSDEQTKKIEALTTEVDNVVTQIKAVVNPPVHENPSTMAESANVVDISQQESTQEYKAP